MVLDCRLVAPFWRPHREKAMIFGCRPLEAVMHLNCALVRVCGCLFRVASVCLKRVLAILFGCHPQGPFLWRNHELAMVFGFRSHALSRLRLELATVFDSSHVAFWRRSHDTAIFFGSRSRVPSSLHRELVMVFDC